jgi:hypothetical protein
MKKILERKGNEEGKLKHESSFHFLSLNALLKNVISQLESVSLSDG